MKSPYIIAEIGSNFRGTIEGCFEQIAAAKCSGADAAKFQLFKHKDLFGVDGHQSGITQEMVPILHRYCQSWGIDFLCSAFTSEDFEFLDPYVKYHKLASCESEDPKLLETLVRLDRPFFRSNGGSIITKVYDHEIPMECVSAYPAQPTDYCFGYYEEMMNWALSDHTLSFILSVLAVGLGCNYFEHHFDGVDTGISTADTPVSFNSEKFSMYSQHIRSAYFIRHREKTISPKESDIVKYYKRRYVEALGGYFRTKPS